ncbi:hypothetical protein XELAEV_18034010mg [Xenopus laevis]|uniref:Arf-GAP with SH3 domain, ANK repeat and PH domain-containing protein 1 n=1 Tax=Xenopus laevis TaxID=8355 RepID=A0A974CKD9_XENLA|nr:hypothetical protein XELAEV_18034010mg [Xenopus laevis]
MIRTEITGAEIAEEMEKERRLFQLQMCEYLIKVNEIKTKKGVDLLQNLIKYYHAQCNFFQDGLKTADKLKQYIEKLAADLYNIKQTQDEEKKQLTALRDLIKSSLQLDQKEDSQSKQTGYSMHQLQGNKEYGSEKKGYLLKKSDGIRKVWQRRKCTVKNGILTISHATSNRPPAKLNLLTCQVKPNADEKKSFDLISHNRTYHFQAEDEQEYIAWISVLTNSKEDALNMAFRGDQSTGESSLEDLTKAIIDDVQKTPGNEVCCDCGSPDPTWLSTNLGILTCIECSGIHREMGVHISRIQSLELDKLGTSELLLAKNVGNNSFNDIMEGNLPSPSAKPSPSSDMIARKEYIIAKYVERRFSRMICSTGAEKLNELLKAVKSRDLLALIQVYAEGAEIMEPLVESGQYDWNLRQEEMDESDDDLEYKPSPIKKERSPRPQSFCHSSSISPQDKLSLPGFITPRDKQRLSYGAFTNQIFMSTSTDSPTSPVADAPPLPPRNAGKVASGPTSTLPLSTQSPSGSCTLSKKRPPPPPPGHKRTLSDPPSPLPHGPPSKGSVICGNDTGLSAADKTLNKFERLSHSVSTGTTKTTLGPRVLPKLPQKVALRKIDTSHHLSMDKYNQQPEIFQKSPQPADLPQKPQIADLPPKPQPSDIAQKPHVGDLPPKPGELPPKPQLADLPPKPQDLPPKPQLKDLPPKPNLAEVMSKTPVGDIVPKPHSHETNQNAQPVDVTHNAQHTDQTPVQKQVPETSNNGPPPLPETPVPLPRKINTGKNKTKRVKTIYDCQADNDDELTFAEGEVIVVTGEEDQEWWIGHIEGFPDRKGVFPVSFVHLLTE